jgi:hypothetical protein
MEGLLLLKWLVRHCALADQPWAVRPQAAPLVRASDLAVELEEGDMRHGAPADKGLPRVWWPVGAPSHQMLPWRKKPEDPVCRADCQETIGDPLKSARCSAILAWRLAVCRALQRALKFR